MRYTVRLLIAALIGSLATAAHAAYPDRPIKLVVPFPPGANNDDTGRLVARGLTQMLGQSVVVENRAGAAGQIGADYVRRAPPDGYTLLLANSGALASVQAFDPALKLTSKNFTPVGAISTSPMVLVVSPKLPVKNLHEFIAYAKARPGKLTMASSGTGGVGHLTGEMFQSMSGTKFLHVPYKGSAPALVALLGGQVDLVFDQPASARSYVESARLLALGVGTQVRSSVMPSVPILAESGLPGFDASVTTGLLFPPGTPQPIREKLDTALRQVLQMPQFKTQLEQLGGDVRTLSGDQFAQLMDSETAKWSKFIHDAGVTNQ
jgi:tripartite-type tricarboxylate transporter receptor subunit TctC